MRALWFAAGASAGVYVSVKARRAAEVVTVEGVHERLAGLFAGARVMAGELRSGRDEAEGTLRVQVEQRTQAAARTQARRAELSAPLQHPGHNL